LAQGQVGRSHRFLRCKKKPGYFSQVPAGRTDHVRSARQKSQRKAAEARYLILPFASFDHGGKTIAAADIDH